MTLSAQTNHILRGTLTPPSQLSNSSSSSTDSIHSTESRRSGTSRIIEKCTRTEQRSTLRPDRPEGRRTEKRKLLYDSTRKKQIRNKILQEDWIWIHACIGKYSMYYVHTIVHVLCYNFT